MGILYTQESLSAGESVALVQTARRENYNDGIVYFLDQGQICAYDIQAWFIKWQ